MSRVYRLPLPAANLGVSKQDIWAITTGATLGAVLEEIRLDPCSATVSDFNISLNLFTGNFTAGAGGSTLTAVPTDPADTGSTFTAKSQNTTQTAVGTGNKKTLDAGAWNLVNGWVWQPLDPRHRIVIPVSACLVISLDTVPANQIFSGNIIVSEGNNQG